MPTFCAVVRLLTLAAVVTITSASDTCDAISGADRVDCTPNTPVTPKSCEAKGCCWRDTPAVPGRARMQQPSCFLPRGSGYSLASVKDTSSGFEGVLTRIKPEGRTPVSMFGGDFGMLHLSVSFETKSRVRVRITDPASPRYEVPIPPPEDGSQGVAPAAADIEVRYTSAPLPFSIDVRRKSDGVSLFNTTDIGALVYSDQYLQWSTRLSSSTLYGLGEHTLPLNLADMGASTSTGVGRDDLADQYQQLEFFARDLPTGFVPYSRTNLYGQHPFYVNFDDDGESGGAHGVFLLNSNAMEVSLQGLGGRKEGRILTWRTIGGIIDLRIFSGPSPSDVVQQYTTVVGRPFMPPYWALGFHLCRWGYNSAQRTNEITDGMIAAGIPMDTQWNDIDYMDRHLDWTYDGDKFKELPAMVDGLHAKGMRYIMIIDPGISSDQGPGKYPAWDEGLKQNVFVKRANGEPLIGKVWPGKTGFPDFFHPNASKWWQDSIVDFHSKVAFDGLWIDMNEVSNFVDGDEKGCPTHGPNGALENPPYVPVIEDRAQSLKAKTVCMSARQAYPPNSPTGTTPVYNLHNLYGYSESVATFAAMKVARPGKRTIVISRSTYPNSGAHAGHWLGDNRASWSDLALSIPGSLAFNMFGIPLVGPDICGFQQDSESELCARWMQLGAFYPFSRNHNELGTREQDPASMGEPVVSAARQALTTRYELLPFLYTLFFIAHRTGDTVMRPLSFEFPDEERFRSADKQFMWGSALLVSPVLEKGANSVKAMLPSRSKWYNYYTGEEIANTDSGVVSLDAPLTGPINLHLRGGSVIPTQEPNAVAPITTARSRTNPFGLVVAMDGDGKASGLMYLDDGESLDSIDAGAYTLHKISACAPASGKDGVVSSAVVSGNGSDTKDVLGSLRIFGLSNGVSSVSIGGVVVDKSKWMFDNSAHVLSVKGLSVSLTGSFSITWKSAGMETLWV